MKRKFTSGVCGLALAGALLTPAALQARQEHAQDNSAANKQERNNPQSATADQAKNNISDRDLMRRIRQDVVKDKSLSTYGHNVKIIAEHGKVTLKGPVHSEEEKQAIEQHARKYAGEGNVVNEITVTADQK